MVKLHYKLNNQREMMDCYRRLLGYVKTAVTRNYSEKVINSILDHVSAAASAESAPELLAEFYETTLRALEEAKNDRLWFKTNVKLARLWFDCREYGRMAKILRELHKSCQNEDGTDDQRKGTQLLEVYAARPVRITGPPHVSQTPRARWPQVEIQMYTEVRMPRSHKSNARCLTRHSAR